MTPLPDLDSLSREDMKSLILALFEQVRALTRHRLSVHPRAINSGLECSVAVSHGGFLARMPQDQKSTQYPERTLIRRPQAIYRAEGAS